MERCSADDAHDGADGCPDCRRRHCVQLFPDHPVAVGGPQYALAYVSLVPLVSLILAGVHSRPSHPEPAIHDRQTDYIVGVPLMVGALLCQPASFRASCRPCSGCGGSTS